MCIIILDLIPPVGYSSGNFLNLNVKIWIIFNILTIFLKNLIGILIFSIYVYVINTQYYLGEEEVSEGKLFNMELFREVYMHILSKGREGCSRRDISKLVGVDKNSIRMAVKKLVAKNVIHIKRVDRGKQRLLV